MRELGCINVQKDIIEEISTTAIVPNRVSYIVYISALHEYSSVNEE